MLHLLGGKDIFVIVSGNYIRSCFGSSINALCQLTVPIRQLSNGQISKLEAAGIHEAKEEPYPVPKELWFLCDLMTKRGLQHESIFSQA